ncbi:MAG TPA: phosphoribosyltransferase family protein [Cyclobacteriaceae bacterium]|nr:phosphoribosyltransferase family protein [Cyclobacteriaceae bacterium]
MVHQSSILFVNRDDAARQLISRLGNYKNMNCCIIATSNGGVAIADHVAKRLNAGLIFIPSERIKDPNDSRESIGVVGFDCTTDGLERDISQDFISRRTRAIRSKLFSRYPNAYSAISSGFKNSTIIFVDDCLQTNDEILSCLRAIRKQQPNEIIVAAPVASYFAAQGVAEEADSVVFLHIVSKDSINGSYLDFDAVADEEVRRLMNLSIKEITGSNYQITTS